MTFCTNWMIAVCRKIVLLKWEFRISFRMHQVTYTGCSKKMNSPWLSVLPRINEHFDGQGFYFQRDGIAPLKQNYVRSFIDELLTYGWIGPRGFIKHPPTGMPKRQSTEHGIASKIKIRWWIIYKFSCWAGTILFTHH